MCVAETLAADHSDWPRLVIGDLSLFRGGPFGREYGGLGHASHQNGLDVDVYYPRKDRMERAATTRAEVDFERATEIVNRFVAAGADRIFVGRTTPLRANLPVVQRLRGHADHLHVRFPDPQRPLPPAPAAAAATEVVAPPTAAPTYPDCNAQN